MGGKNHDALCMADEFLSRSGALSDPVLMMVAHRVMGSTLLTIGDFQSSATHFEETIRLSVRKGKQPLYHLYMVEPQAASLLLLSWDLWFLGYPERSLSRVSEALALAQDLGHPYTIAFGGRKEGLMRRALLEPICRWFDEGAGTADLRRARDAQSGLH